MTKSKSYQFLEKYIQHHEPVFTQFSEECFSVCEGGCSTCRLHSECQKITPRGTIRINDYNRFKSKYPEYFI